MKKLALFILILLTFSPAQAGKALTMLEQFQQVSALRADFSQTLEDANGKLLQQQSGTLALAKPGRIFWHYQTPKHSEQYIVADGKTLTFYDVDLEEANIKPFSDALGSAPIALLTTDKPLAQSFKIIELGLIDNQYMLQLESKVKDTDFGMALLVFNQQGDLTTMQLRDPMEQITTIRFSNLKLNPKLKSDQFNLTLPKNVHVTRTGTAN